MKKNPFRISYLSIVAVCFVAISCVFLVINQINYKAEQKRFHQQKAETIMKEFENQLSLMEDVSIRIGTNYEFQPYYFRGKIDRELSLLKTLAQYQHASMLTDDYFLYYGDDYVYRSADSTLNLDLYLKKNMADETERQMFLQEITDLQEEFADIWSGIRILPFSEKLFVLAPFRAKSDGDFMAAILCFTVDKEALEERLQFVSGGYEGNLSIYRESELLYCNQETTDVRNEASTIMLNSADGTYTLYYEPVSTGHAFSNHFWIQFCLIFADIVLVVILANIWAEKAYKPIRNIAEKYHNQMAQSEMPSEDALQGIDHMLDSAIKSNSAVTLKNQEQRKTLKNHYLDMLLQNNNSLDALACLEEMDVRLLASCYRVVSISYSKELSATDDFLNMLGDELERITNEDANEYVYAYYNYKKKLINVICNYDSSVSGDVLLDVVVSVAESFSYAPTVGIGNAYHTLSGLSASWLESQNVIYEQENMKLGKQVNFVYKTERLQPIISALEIGNEKMAMEKLEQYVVSLNETARSLLMLKYVFSEFMGEITNLSRKHHVDLSAENISLMIAANNVQDFKIAAAKLIGDFSKRFAKEKSEQKDDELFRIYEYISSHYLDYDISLEGVAEIFQVNTMTVRRAVIKYADMAYKEYIIFLRIEYAKKLLQEQELSIGEVCQKVGYANISYFIRLFREQVGVTPSKYRNKSS